MKVDSKPKAWTGLRGARHLTISGLAALLVFSSVPGLQGEAVALYRFTWADQLDPLSVSMANSITHPTVTASDVVNNGFVRDPSNNNTRRNRFSINASNSINNHLAFSLSAPPDKPFVLEKISFTTTLNTGAYPTSPPPFRIDIRTAEGATFSQTMPGPANLTAPLNNVLVIPPGSVPASSGYEIELHAQMPQGRFDDITVDARVAPEVIDVFFLSGQSNMSGRVPPANTPTSYVFDPVRDPKVRYYYRTDGPKSEDNRDSLGHIQRLAPLDTSGYGAEISFARALVDKGYNPLIVKISDGGTHLWWDWNSRKDPATDPEALTNPDAAQRIGIMWRSWQAGVTEALQSLIDEGHTLRIRGFGWSQGESDQNPAERRDAYPTSFRNLLADMVTHLDGLGLDASGMRYVTALTKGSDIGSGPREIRAAQRAVMGDFGVLGHWFDTNDFGTLDGTHYDVAAVETMGLRFAAPFPTQLTPYALWMQGFPAVPADQREPDDDWEQDGFTNLVEFALDLNPAEINIPSEAFTYSLLEDGANDYLVITYSQRAGGTGTVGVDYAVDGIVYSAEAATSLAPSNFATSTNLVEMMGTPVDNGDGTQTVMVRSKSPLATQPMQFLRLKIRQP